MFEALRELWLTSGITMVFTMSEPAAKKNVGHPSYHPSSIQVSNIIA